MNFINRGFERLIRAREMEARRFVERTLYERGLDPVSRNAKLRQK